jgi:DNA-binding MarR family transcriptional regulator
MLSQNLKALTRAGLIDRHVEPTTPPQVTYSLTRLGEGLAEPLCGLLIWFGANTDDMVEAQRRYDTGAVGNVKGSTVGFAGGAGRAERASALESSGS